MAVSLLLIAVVGLAALAGLLFAGFQAYTRRRNEPALNDTLTSLGNHHAFYEDFSREYSRARRRGHHLTLALIDIDDLKTMNELHGHQHGDRALIDIAKVLRSGRVEDRAYRIGGDEFAMLFAETSEREAKIALTRIQDMADRNAEQATISIGLCELAPEYDEQDFYKRAEAALFAAKRSGRRTITRFSEIETTTKIFPSRKSAALLTLLEEGALEIAFQPIWKLDGTGMVGFEALARPDPALGFLGPQEAFDIAERMRDVAELDALCIQKVFAAAPRLPQDATLFINVSPETLSRPDFHPENWVQAINDASLNPKQLVVEVTERRITNPAELVSHAARLQRLGIRIALDDAGSGYAGLEILGKLPLDFVKIDRSILVSAMTGAGARGVLAGIIAIARETATHVITEGVESRQQLDFIRNLPQELLSGIYGVQGYLLGRPRIGAFEIEDFLPYGRLLSSQSSPMLR